MFKKNLGFSFPIMLAFLWVSCSERELTTPHAPTTIAYFDEDGIKDLLGTRDCVALRFYPSLRWVGDAGTAVVIPVDKNGRELYSWWGQRYRQYSHVSGDGVRTDGLAWSAARTSVRLVGDGGGHMCSAEFSSKELLTALAVKDANGVHVSRATTAEGAGTLAIGPVQLVDGGARPVGVSADIFGCAQPCPSLCPTEPYLHR